MNMKQFFCNLFNINFLKVWYQSLIQFSNVGTSALILNVESSCFKYIYLKIFMNILCLPYLKARTCFYFNVIIPSGVNLLRISGFKYSPKRVSLIFSFIIGL